MKAIISAVVIAVTALPSYAFYPGPLSGASEINSVELNTDLAHGRMLVIGRHLYYGTFDRDAWQYDDYRTQARIEKRNANTIELVSSAVFPDDMHHRNVADVQYSPRQHRIYVLFMGGVVASVDPECLGWVDVNQPEDIRANEMGKLVISPDYIYRISQTYPTTTLTQYNADNGVELRRIALDVPAGHGGLYAVERLYVTTSQNDGLGSMIYVLQPHTLEVLASHRISACENIAPDFDLVYNHDGHPWLVFACEGRKQDKTFINNLFIADAYWPSSNFQYSTNAAVQGGIWGVTAAHGMIYISRGSDPATVEVVNPWEHRSMFYEIKGVSGCNGGVDVVGNRIYWKAYQQMHHADRLANIGWMDIE